MQHLSYMSRSSLAITACELLKPLKLSLEHVRTGQYQRGGYDRIGSSRSRGHAVRLALHEGTAERAQGRILTWQDAALVVCRAGWDMPTCVQRESTSLSATWRKVT